MIILLHFCNTASLSNSKHKISTENLSIFIHSQKVILIIILPYVLLGVRPKFINISWFSFFMLVYYLTFDFFMISALLESFDDDYFTLPCFGLEHSTVDLFLLVFSAMIGRLIIAELFCCAIGSFENSGLIVGYWRFGLLMYFTV